MDIWQWVHDRQDTLYDSGHDELANYIDQISNHAVNDKFDLVDQVYHAAMPLCRAMEDKWLEIYFRHWRLQAHVLKNYDAKGLLPEAIALLDFSHAEETKDCPQRICAVQDLAACYGIKDGPGFAEERVAVCRETLAQIDGSWPCYECVSGELVDALMDAKKYKLAEEEVEKTNSEIAKYRENKESELILTQTRLYLEKGNAKKAWDLIKNATNPLAGEGFEREQKLLKTLTLCHLGQWEDALKIVPKFEDALIAATYYKDWTRIQKLLLGRGLVQNDRELRYNFHLLADKLVSKQAMRDAFIIYSDLIDLCVLSQEAFRAEFVIQQMKLLVPEFNRDLGAKRALADFILQAENIAPLENHQSFETVEDLLEHKFQNETLETKVIEEALEKWPEDVRLAARRSELLQGCFQYDKAFDILSIFYRNHKGSSLLESKYGSAYLAKHGFEKFQSEFPMEKLEGLSKGAIWNRGFKYVNHFEKEHPEKAMEHLKTIEQYWEDDVWLLGKIAYLYVRLKNYDEAITYRRKQRKLEPENNNHDWDLLIAATLKQDNALVCEMAKKLEIDVNSDGQYPVDQQSRLRLQWKETDGTIEEKRALRLAPAIARITFVSRMEDKEQIYGREVVFDPAPLNRLDQKDDEGYACDVDGNYTLLYPLPLDTLHDPKYKTYAVDGLHPGKEALETLTKKIAAKNFIYQQRSTKDYRITWEEGDTSRDDLGVYIYILIKDGEQSELNAILSDFNRDLTHPMVWPELANDLKDKTLLEQQTVIIEKYNIHD